MRRLKWRLRAWPGLFWLFWLCVAWPGGALRAEDGYALWLRYVPLEPALREAARAQAAAIVPPAASGPSAAAATGELRRGLEGLLGASVPLATTAGAGSIVVGTPSNQPVFAGLGLPLAALGDEGYLLRSARLGEHPVTLIAANSDRGLVYGVFEFLRLVQTGAPLGQLDLAARPRVALRLLNHWDNLDRFVERGYAGQSIWDWWRLPEVVDPRYDDYARANASIGINGTVLNNVNAAAEILNPTYLAKVAVLAGVLRPWGLRVFLSVRFSAPADIGGLPTADPLDPAVRAWWRAKTDEIYALIPDFGGFLVKANSEGQPGPQDYGRSHADGARLLADALAPHGGVVLWRAFVYAPGDGGDRVKQAFSEFRPLDGQFGDGVLLQVKNGPLDFQPREPFHPLFGAMPATPLALELQITQEYLGFSTHLVYLGTLWEEVLRADTHAAGAGSAVARVVDGSLHGHALSGMAGVANIGSDRDWTGAPFAQANWYAFGRLAWDPQRSARGIAEEWLRMTFSNEPEFVARAAALMMRSREAAVDYMTPLGLAHLMGSGHHYGPAPWVDDLARPEWNPWYYHRADATGIGFDRGAAGSNAVAQYAPALAREFADPERVPERFLLWFHRLPWDHPMRSGRSLWEELVLHYDRGVAEVEGMRAEWVALERFVDAERWRKTLDLLTVQASEARWWRDACLAYFAERSGRPLPAGTRPPEQPLEYYRALRFPFAPGDPAGR